MSTVDPAEVRRRKAGHGPGRERLLRRATAYYVAGTALSVLLGMGAALLFDMVRGTTIMPAGSGSVARSWLLTVGLLAGVAGLFLLAYASEMDRRSRDRMQSSGLARFLALTAVTGGVVIAILAWWSRPPTVGRTPDPFGDEPPARWGFGSWLLYTAWWWLPILLAVGSVALLLVWRRTERQAAAAAAVRDHLLANGARTTGVVTDARVLISATSEGGRSVAGAIGTVRFTADGVDRWVERRTRDAATVVVGAPAEVLYDPADPGAEQRIFVAFVRDPAPAEWIPASSRTTPREGQ